MGSLKALWNAMSRLAADSLNRFADTVETVNDAVLQRAGFETPNVIDHEVNGVPVLEPPAAGKGKKVKV